MAGEVSDKDLKKKKEEAFIAFKSDTAHGPRCAEKAPAVLGGLAHILVLFDKSCPLLCQRGPPS